MAELTTLARPYAKAAFDCAGHKGELDLWSSFLADFSTVVADPKVSVALKSPKLTADKKSSLLLTLLGDALNESFKRFILVLADNHRLNLVAAIRELFENLKAQQQQFSEVNLRSAFELEAATEKTLAEKLRKTLNTDVSINTVLDPSLLGGVIVRAGDTVIDSSVKGRLAKLSASLDV
ncbi:MAG: F0F1 ATP synthase subunit delta [Cellvibrionaceae bacterium]|nr:F0F1 ATP synthase subunit delta [Cellvibrionaceae bacterium]